MSEHDAAWLRAARMEALEAEVRRLQAAEAYWTDETYRAKFERLARAGEVYFEELRVKNADLVAQLAASQAEGAALRGLLWEFTPDEESYEYDNEDGECRFCGTSSLLKKPPYPHTADCLVTRARALLTPPAAPGADTSAPVTD